MTQETLEERYNIYLSCANDGRGRDITTGGKTYLKTFDQWLDDQPGDPAPTEELTPKEVRKQHPW